MARHQQHRDQASGGSPRQLRVGELIRHELADMLTRGEIHDPVIEGHMITVPEVRMSPDLRLATIYVMPLGGRDAETVIEAFERNKRYVRGEIARRVNLKFAPEIRFRVDERFDEAERIQKLLRTPAVQRDLDDEQGRIMSVPELTSLPDSPPQETRDPSGRGEQKKIKKRDVHGWVVLDKPIGMTSTHAVAVIKRLFSAKRAGHAGTLDPLASGSLPIALGEATKTVPFVVDSRKIYVFTVRWGEERDTDDAEGRVINSSELRPDAVAIREQLPRFTGTISQIPPRYSAVKIAGERAYDLARDGETVELAPRAVEIHRLELVEMPDPDHAVLTPNVVKAPMSARWRAIWAAL